jgi:Domain of unknown function (DUF4747)
MNMQLFAINIAAQKHEKGPQTYEDLLRALFDLRVITKVHGARHSQITEIALQKNSNGKSIGFSGVISTFTVIDTNSNWFDAKNLKPVSKKERAKITLPSDVFPDLKIAHYYFDFATHKMAVLAKFGEARTTPTLTKRLFDELLENSSVQERFGTVSATVCPDHAVMKELLNVPRLYRLESHIKPANPDEDGEGFEDELVERLKIMHAKEYNEDIVSSKGQRLLPDARAKAHAEIASKNGHCIAYGRDDNGHQIRKSTVDKPLLQNFEEPKNIILSSTFLSNALKFIKQLAH